MHRKTLCTVILLYLWPCCVVACRAQENSAAAPPPPVKLTATQEESKALDFALNNLRNLVFLNTSLSQTPISLLREKKVLFDSKAWPTYQPSHRQIMLGDLSLVAKRKEEDTQDMDRALKIIAAMSLWQRAFKELYPECGLWISSCDLSHTKDNFHIHLSFGPSSHGAGADYIVKPEGKTWKIVKRDILFVL